MTLAMPGVADGRLEREQLLVAELARADVGRRLVEAALGQPVADHVLGGGDDARREVGALERLDVGAAELGGEVRVLAVGLLDAAPARVARDVEDRGEGVAGAPVSSIRRRIVAAIAATTRGRSSPPRRSTAGSTARPRR